MQNITLTQTAGGTTSVTIHVPPDGVDEITSKITNKIPQASSTRGTTIPKTLIIDLHRIITSFSVRGYLEDEQRTRLNGAHTNSVTTITVDSTTGFASSGIIKVGQELITYTGTTATTFTGCVRGLEGTNAIAHIDDEYVYLPAQQFRDQLFTIYDNGGCFQMAYRRKNWSVAFDGLKVRGMPSDSEAPNMINVEFTVTVGEDRVNKNASSGLVTGRN